MTAIALQPDKAELIRKVLALAQSLRQTRDGAVLFEQLQRGNRERIAIHDSVESAFMAFAHTLLHQYTKNRNNDPATRVRAILIQQRIAPYLERGESAATPGAGGGPVAKPDSSWATPAFEQHVASVLWSVRNLTPLARGRASVPGVQERRAQPAHLPADSGKPSGFRPELLHDSIAKLGNLLGAELDRAVADSLDFVANIKTANLALLGTRNEQDIVLLRQILIESTEELIRGHTVLVEHLRTANSHLGKLRSQHDALRSETEQYQSKAMTDSLTGIPNRAAFMRRLVAETGRAQRHGYPLALAIVDPDRLDDIGSKAGGDAANEVMRCYAREILSKFRAHDMVARLGKGEFAVLLPDTEQEQAVSALHKARHRVASTFYVNRGKRLRAPTFSSGLACYVAGERPWNLLQRADRALHRAKSSGTDRIEAVAR